MASRWHIEKASEPLDRRVYVSIVALSAAGFGLWYLAETRQLEAYGVIVGGCAGVAALLLFADLLGIAKLRAPTLREVVITPQKVMLNAGHVQQSVLMSEVVRIDVRTHRYVEPMLVLVSGDNLSCAIPRAAWTTLEIETRLRRLSDVRWQQMSRALAAADERTFVLWKGAAGEAVAFATDSP